MDFQKLKTFQTVATLMNFNRAAEVLHYAQSSVSAQIKTLEEEVGVLLFKRNGKQVSLTESGSKMLKYTNRILALGEEALSDLNGGLMPEGLLTIRAPQTVATCYLPGILKEFQPQHPKVKFDVNSCAFHTLENELRLGTVDIAFLLTESLQAAHLNVEMLSTEKLVVVAAPEHPLVNKSVVGYGDLLDCPVFLPKSDCGYRMPFDHALTVGKIEPALIMEFNSVEAIKECVKAGLGVTVIPEIAVQEEFKTGSLVPLSWEEDLEVALLMIWHQDQWLSPTLIDFMDTVRRVAG